MNTTKKILVLVLTLVMLLSCAFADALPKVAVQDMELTSDTALDLFVYDSIGISDAGKLSVAIDGTKADVLGMEPYNKNVSWVFLVDTSVVSTKTGSAPITGMLEGLINGMGDNDLGVIFTPAASGSRELKRKSDMPKKKDFGEWMSTDDKRSLADGVVDALDFLNMNAPYGRTNLVIISDGNSKNMDALSYSALAQTIAISNTCVYSVAFTSNPDKSMLDQYLALGESSKGGMGIEAAGKQGMHTAPLKAIGENEKLFKNLHVRLPGKLATARTLTLTADVNSSSTISATTTVPENVAKYITSNITIPPIAPTPEPSWIKEHLNLVIIAGAVLLAMIVALVIILVVTRKKKNEIVEVDDAPPPPPVNTEVRITLTREEDGEQFSAVTQGGVCVVGRSSDVDMPLSDSSMKISREHMQLSYENGIVMLQDLGSRNHTYVNNAMVNRKTVMQQGDIIHMGDHKFRISWRQL